VIGQPSYPVEPWCLRETELRLDLLAQAESVFALSNGHIGWRANLDEGEPHGLPGTYLNGVYELRPLPYAERGYGFPESGQTVVNVTNGKVIRLLVDDEPFDIRYGELRSHERLLDFRSGVLSRTAEWVSPAGRLVQIRSERIVSLTQRAICAISYEVEPVDGPARLVVQSELVANEQLPDLGGDPRVAAALSAPLRLEFHFARDAGALLMHCTKRSRLRVGSAMSHIVNCEQDTGIAAESFPDVGRVTVTAFLRPGQRLRIIKFVAYGWSAIRSQPAVRDQLDAALTAAQRTGWEGLLAEQREFLDDFWGRADVELDGDTEIQQAVRFGLFHLLQAGARAEARAIPAKGLTGPGYDGHTFWDTEMFVLPALTYTVPEAAAAVMRWRHSTLDSAYERAKQLNLAGAAFPWRTIHGEECSGYWPAGTAAFHIGADIADAVIRYVHATGDEEFERTIGLDLLTATARLFRSLGHHDAAGSFRIDGVTGPDEYSAIADNNVYTNLMAARNLRGAAEAAIRHPQRAHELGVDEEEMASWRDAAEAMFIPYDEALGVHPQNELFTSHEVWDFGHTPPENYPLLLHYPYFDLYRKQVVKQADLVLAMQTCPDAFTEEQMARNFDYYERLTVRDSSLSACTQSSVAAQVGHLRLAYDYLAEAALMDLADLEHNTRDGLHIASLTGAWSALVTGFGGMHRHNSTIGFAPRLPEGISRLAFTVTVRGRRLRVEITDSGASYVLTDGEPLEILHYRKPLTVSMARPLVLPIPPVTIRPSPQQPRGRAPAPRMLREMPRTAATRKARSG
jgi:alpha,alpha-trehalose phosphorylase